ncbi:MULTISPECIES: hypothetical protein [Pseudomonas]|uniref:hypothetical protein n=1 Tax=Pseudomonas TaxID=286 RepID=UPI0016451A26|nr:MULTISPECIES: hypothetical protein [Pseudomonas]MBK3453254.1 hypothetical protein [Pseudomonas sp. MF6754]QXH87745.1 hypothetical protein HU773_019020 [Pseudomonas shahriarae]
MTEQLCVVFIPALSVVLQSAETNKGFPLTESEALKIRDQATCVAVPFEVALDMENERGFRDIVAEDCWNEWQRLRLSMKKFPL